MLFASRKNEADILALLHKGTKGSGYPGLSIAFYLLKFINSYNYVLLAFFDKCKEGIQPNL